jgi:hypothetical protein
MKYIPNYKHEIGDCVKIDTSLMDNKIIAKCKSDGLLDICGIIVDENEIRLNNNYVWEHEVDFGIKTKIIVACYLKKAKI